MQPIPRPARLLTIVILGISALHAGHRVSLGPYVLPPARTLGLIVKARVNGGPVLRLLLDSGTQYLVLDRKAARKSACGGGADLDLVGAGGPATVVERLQARTVELGDLTLRDVPVLIANRQLPDGLQGVFPLSALAEFLIRLDIPGKSLDLQPYPREQAETQGALPAVSNNQLLFLKGTVNETHEGYFLLDTGASYNAISRNMVRRLNISEALASLVPMQGGVAEMDAPLLTGQVRLRLPTNELVRGPVVALDLSTASRYHNLEVSGLIGYPALSESVLSVNYRDSLVAIGSRGNGQ